jgi:penicillin-binding protein 1A
VSRRSSQLSLPRARRAPRRPGARGIAAIDLTQHAILIPFVILAASALVAAGLFPLVSAAGHALQRFDRQFRADEEKGLDVPAFPLRSTIYAADGSVLATLADENRIGVPLSDVNDVTRKAVLAIEDHGFYQHGPVDVFSIIRAAAANLRAGKVVQGGSTISQQLIKNTETGNAETFARKFREAQDAIRLERHYSKNQIFELYLNEIYLGHGAYGIGSAAEYYFARPVQKLNLPQAALLAGLISSPARWDPIEHPDAAIGRRNAVLNRMLSLKWIAPDEYAKAIGRPIKLSGKMRNVNTLGPEPYFVQYVKDTILHPSKQDPNYQRYLRVFGKTYQDRRTSLFQGGMKIYTTLEPTMQREAAVAVQSHLPHQGAKPPADPQAAVVTVVPQTGAIEAMYGGRDFSKQQFNLATQSGRSAGSAFKAFTLTAALEQGVPVGKVYDGTSPAHIPFEKCPDKAGEWMPSNAADGEGSGFINMATATADSINVYFAQLIADVGPANVSNVAKEMGVQSYARDALVDVPPVCAITLGTVSVNPLSMTSGYSTLADAGVHCYPFAIARVVSPGGKLLYKAKRSCQPVVDPRIASQVTDLLKGVVQFGTGTAANIGRPMAGKTGTGQTYQDAWFMGYIPQLVTGVWVGYSKDEIPMEHLAVLHGANAFGGTIAAPIWHDYMEKAVAGLQVRDFPAPPAPKSGTVPDVTGLKQDDAVKKLADANYTAIVKEVACDKPAGIVCSQSPAGGTTLQLGSGVTINVSNGKAAKVKVPSVVGLTSRTAIAALKAAGFDVTVTYEKVANPKKDDIVLSQNPTAGVERKQGTIVTIVVGQFQPVPSPSPSPPPTPPPRR